MLTFLASFSPPSCSTDTLSCGWLTGTLIFTVTHFYTIFTEMSSVTYWKHAACVCLRSGIHVHLFVFRGIIYYHFITCILFFFQSFCSISNNPVFRKNTCLLVGLFRKKKGKQKARENPLHAMYLR